MEMQAKVSNFAAGVFVFFGITAIEVVSAGVFGFMSSTESSVNQAVVSELEPTAKLLFTSGKKFALVKT